SAGSWISHCASVESQRIKAVCFIVECRERVKIDSFFRSSYHHNLLFECPINFNLSLAPADEADGPSIGQARTPGLPAICAHLRRSSDKSTYLDRLRQFRRVNLFLSCRG